MTTNTTRQGIGREFIVAAFLSVLLAVSFGWFPNATVAVPPVSETILGLIAGIIVAVTFGRLTDHIPIETFVTRNVIFLFVIAVAIGLGLVVFPDGLPYVLQVAVFGLVWGTIIETVISTTASDD